MTTRVLVADSLSVFRAGASSVLGRSGGWDVCEASDLAGVHTNRRRPLVALVHSVPLVSEALADALEDVGDEAGAIAVFLSPRSGQVKALGQITQDSVAIADASPEAVRGLLVGLLRAGEPAL